MNNRATNIDLEEPSKSLKDYINMLRRHKRVLVASWTIVVFLFILLAFLWPPTYRSQAIILIEQQEIPDDLVQTTITSYAQQRIEEIKQRIMTISNIIGIVEEFELYTDRELERLTRTEIAEEFRRAVSIKPISAEVVDPRSGRPTQAIIAFSLVFDGEVPSKVQKVTNELTTLYLDENLKERTEQSLSTAEFLTAEAKMLSSQLEKLDSDLAKFKSENEGALPQQKQYNNSVIDRLELQISDLDFQIKELKKRRFQLEGDLTQISPSAPTMLADGRVVLGDTDRLKSIESQLLEAEAKYKDQHPTLVRLRREREQLKNGTTTQVTRDEILTQLAQQQNHLSTLQQDYKEDHPEIIQTYRTIASLNNSLINTPKFESEVRPDNPAYLTLKIRLDATNEDIIANEEKISKLREKIEEHEGYLSRAPEVEQTFQTLTRDYDNTYVKYQEIRAKQMAAELAKNLESEQKGERFTLIQPPELPIDPVSPNRVALVLIGLILGVGVGVGAVILLETINNAIYSRSDILLLTGDAPLAEISFIETQEEQSKHNLKRLYILIGIIGLGILLLLLFHLFIKPLDVTWYVILRKLGF